MEKIKSYHSIKSFLTDEQRKKVAVMLNLSQEDLTRRLEGKESEYEFLIRCYLLDQLEDIIAFEEGVSRLTDTKTTDFLFITKTGKRLAVEVKSTEKDTWKISSKVFQEKKDFAELVAAELYFAIKIKNVWLFLSGTYIEENNYKVKIDSYLKSEFDILGEKSFLIKNSIKIKSIYNTNSKRSLGIGHPDYGHLERYSIETENKVLLKITPSSKDKLFVALALEALQDSASNHSQNIEILGLGRTLITEQLPENCIFHLSHFLISPITHISSDYGMTYDLSSYIAEIVDTKESAILKENHIINVLALLHKSGVEIHEAKNGDFFDLSQIYVLD